MFFPGEEWRLEELDKRIASSSVVSQIHRIDYYDKTSELYNMFDIFVLPSIKPDSPTYSSPRSHGLFKTSCWL